jgi:hypothetical protein
MSDYVLEIRYREDEPSLQVPLTGCTPDEAEAKRQALIEEIEHAIKLHTPPVALNDMDADLPADVQIDPARVTDVLLVESG